MAIAVGDIFLTPRSGQVFQPIRVEIELRQQRTALLVGGVRFDTFIFGRSDQEKRRRKTSAAAAVGVWRTLEVLKS